MNFDKAPVPADLAQWPEARGFSRLYSKNPEYQARLVMALFGFRQDLTEWAHDEESARVVEDTILAFYGRHSEFMQDGFVHYRDIGTGVYHLDDRLQNLMTKLISRRSEPESEQ